MFEAAREFVLSSARPLEVALFRYHFENGSSDACVMALQNFQNSDGGFGQALEPDIRLPESSVLCTTVALQTAVSLDLDSDHELVIRALDYLENQFNSELNCWLAVPGTVNDHPHAPWWHQDLSTAPKSQPLQRNPGLEVAAYLIRWQRSTVVESWLSHVVNELNDLEHHELLCLARLAETPNLTDQMRSNIHKNLAKEAANTIATTPEDWPAYSLKPLTAITSPNSSLATSYVDSINTQFEFEKAQQDDSGAWLPPWSWADLYPDEWELAKTEWAGVLTLDMLLKFKAFNQL